MSDPSDIELQREPAYAPPPPPRSKASWILILIALGLVLALGWYFLGRSSSAPPEPTDVSETDVPAGTQSLGEPPEPAVELPPLADTDPLARELVRALSAHPRVAAWLTTDGLIRNFTVAVQNVADGQVPAQSLRMLRPTGPFVTTATASGPQIDPRSYDRYDSLADAVAGIDPGGAARAYATLKPRIEEAYAELGESVPFDQTLERAIVMLLRTPEVPADASLRSQGALFAFRDPRFEQLTPAQKQLARMGPRNARIVKDKLRAIVLALGIPAERLPS